MRARRAPAAGAALMISAGAALVAAPNASAATLDADVKRVTTRLIQPAFARLATDTGVAVAAVDALYAAPSAQTLAAARAGFVAALDAFAAASVYDFGPARADDRFARLLFWPDRGGRGLRAVEAMIARPDPALDVAALRGERVDVQGFPALEYALFGNGSGTLSGAGGADRRRVAQAIAGAIATTAGELRDAWTAPDGYAATFTAPYAADGVYRDPGEATRELLRVAGQVYAGVGKLYLTAPLGESAEAARPKRAVFWRSGQTFAFLDTQLAGVEALFGDDGLGPALSEGAGAAALNALAFESSQARDALAPQSTDASTPGSNAVLAAFADPQTRARLVYVKTLADGAAAVVSPRITNALGLIVGFNSLDGD